MGTKSCQGTAWDASCDARRCERASTAPRVNKATGDALSAKRPSVEASGAGSTRPLAEATAPSKIDQGMGLDATPVSALFAASQALPPPRSRRDKAMHSEEVSTISITMVRMAGPTDAAPKNATSKGTPMKPVLGKAPTSAPIAPSFQPMRPPRCALRVSSTNSATMISAQAR